MALLFLAPLLALPIIEIVVLVLMGATIGFWPTVALVLGAGVLGVALLRIQGLEMMRNLERAMARREVPPAALFDGVCLALAGLLLILPGFVSDVLALLLLLPPVRWALRRWLARGMGPGSGPGRGPGGGTTVVIEGEWTEVDPGDTPSPPGGDRRIGPG